MLLKTKERLKHIPSLSDPTSVNLEKVSNIIVDQSLKDHVFSKEAGRICYTIVQVRPELYITFKAPQEAFKLTNLPRVFPGFGSALPPLSAHRFLGRCHQAEAKQNNGSVFRRHLLNRLQQEFKDREDMRARSLQEWVCYVTFICNIFDYLKVRAREFVFPLLKSKYSKQLC